MVQIIFKRIGKGPLNNQNLRIQLVKELLESYKPLLIIETGTFLGDTTEFLSKFSNVISIEKSRLFYYLSKSRFHNENQIQIIYGKSEVELKKIKTLKKIPFLFGCSLGRRSALKRRGRTNYNNYLNYLIFLNNFAVPNDNSWGFDSYEGTKLDIDMLKNLENTKIYFPDYNSDAESGEKRGSVFLTNSDDVDYIFKKNNFKLYDKNKFS